MKADVPFSIEPPDVPRVRVVATDLDTGKSKCATLYDTTPQDFIEMVKRLGTKRKPAGAAS